jgi:hypothetical protein
MAQHDQRRNFLIQSAPLKSPAQDRRRLVNCPDCGVESGNWHEPDCVGEQCPYHGEHAMDCECDGRPAPLDDRILWMGLCPWEQTCRDFGFFEREARGKWIQCDADEDGCEPDVSRLLRECRWDRDAKQFVTGKTAAW